MLTRKIELYWSMMILRLAWHPEDAFDRVYKPTRPISTVAKYCLLTELVVAPHEPRPYIFIIRFCEVPKQAAILFAGSRLARPKTSSSHVIVGCFIDHK